MSIELLDKAIDALKIEKSAHTTEANQMAGNFIEQDGVFTLVLVGALLVAWLIDKAARFRAKKKAQNTD